MTNEKFESCADALTAAYVYDKENIAASVDDISYKVHSFYKCIHKEITEIEKLTACTSDESATILNAAYVDQHFMKIVDITEKCLRDIKETAGHYLDNRISFLKEFADARKRIAEYLRESQKNKA